jgi:hypothetical protein
MGARRQGLLINPGDPEALFDVAESIGRGSYGSVYTATRRADGQAVAVKLLNIGETASSREALDREIEALRMCTSPYIVAFEGAYLDGAVLWIAMERCFCSCLDAMHARGAALAEHEIRAIAASTLAALEYLHGLRFVHRDVKASNLLLTRDGRCKLCDLGVAAELGPGGKRGTVIGTPLWMSPELIQDGAYDEKTDVWSLGITVLELAEQHPPHWQINPPVRALFLIPAAPAPKLANPTLWSADLSEFVGLCLDKDARARRSAAELRASGFIAGTAGAAEAQGEGAVLMPLVFAVEAAHARRASSAPVSVFDGSGRDDGATAAGATLLAPIGAAEAATLAVPLSGPATAATLVLAHGGAQPPPPARPLTVSRQPSYGGTLGGGVQSLLADSDAHALNGTLIVARSPRPELLAATDALAASAVEALLRDDIGCGTLLASGAQGVPQPAAPRRAVILGFPLRPTPPAPVEAVPPSPPAASAPSGGGEPALELTFASWMQVLASATGDHARAALELGSLMLRRPGLVAQFVDGHELAAIARALERANDPTLQRALLAELERAARGAGGVRALVEATAHTSVIGIAFTPFEPQHAGVRSSAIELLSLMADSEEGHDAVSAQQFFDPLCALARVLNNGDSAEDSAHAAQVVALLCKLLDGQQARTPAAATDGAPHAAAARASLPARALERMRNSSHELLSDLFASCASPAVSASQSEVQRLIAQMERVLLPVQRSNTQARGTYFAPEHD